MATNKNRLQEIVQFIHEHRSSEGNFKILYDRLVAEYEAAQANKTSTNYAEALRETIEKHASLYKKNKEKGISTWSEFENVIKHFEKSVTAALHQA